MGDYSVVEKNMQRSNPSTRAMWPLANMIIYYRVSAVYVSISQTNTREQNTTINNTKTILNPSVK